jgi:hypothetical protein
LNLTTSEKLPPNFRKLDTALRAIGYSFESAVADVIDNSVDARAREILVRIIVRRDGHLDLVIRDDGTGMSGLTLREAMRFGADVAQEVEERLGKFGLGLKLATLSQAREIHVFTRKDGELSGRAWLESGISDGFASTIFDRKECQKLLDGIVPDQPLGTSGTLVWWSQLYRVGHHPSAPDEHAQKLLNRLKNHLALAFHRFLEGGRARQVRIALDIFDQTDGAAGLAHQLDPLNPFGYPQSGRTGFPKTLLLSGPYQGRVKISAHVWPPNSSLPEYKLPGGANSRQGFYFYRNNRLIQAGGWNGIREAEPHSSLARIEVDLAEDVDLEVSLDVKKVEIHLPPALTTAIQQSRSSDGIDFRKYLALADDTYRKKKPTQSELPLIPSAGLPAAISELMHEELRIEATAKHKDVKIRWKRLERDDFFELDRDELTVYINQAYRRKLMHGRAGSAADIPVVKCLLFFALEDALSGERLGPRSRERAELMNRILTKAVRYERDDG